MVPTKEFFIGSVFWLRLSHRDFAGLAPAVPSAGSISFLLAAVRRAMIFVNCGLVRAEGRGKGEAMNEAMKDPVEEADGNNTKKPSLAIYRTWARPFFYLVAVFAICVAVLSILAAGAHPSSKSLRVALGLIWGLGPPGFFFLETALFYPWFGLGTPESEKRLKEIQSLASKFWAGVGTAIALIFLTCKAD